VAAKPLRLTTEAGRVYEFRGIARPDEADF
jgi:hypothetical protein